jgi:CDP-diacylglycerol---glycerol-3-phosphate 3-phosphatidyltransferase
LLVFYGRGNRFFYVVLAALAMISAIMVSYARARAESLIGTCRVGFMERPERLVLLIIGALFNEMAPVLWVIAVLSTITVVHRVIYTWQRTTEMDAPARAAWPVWMGRRNRSERSRLLPLAIEIRDEESVIIWPRTLTGSSG